MNFEFLYLLITDLFCFFSLFLNNRGTARTNTSSGGGYTYAAALAQQQQVAQQVRFISVISLIGCDVALTSNSCYLTKKRCVYSYFLTWVLWVRISRIPFFFFFSFFLFFFFFWAFVCVCVYNVRLRLTHVINVRHITCVWDLHTSLTYVI